MSKLYILGLISLAGSVASAASAEEITITTYYPAPYGVYQEMEAKKSLAAGDISESDLLGIDSIDDLDKGELWVQDSVIFEAHPAPVSGKDGELIYDSSVRKFKYYDSFAGEWKEQGGGIPSGFCIFSNTQANCPSGWTRTVAFDGRTVRGAAAPGGTGGGPHSHIASNAGSHSHGVGGSGGIVTTGEDNQILSAGTHTHTISAVVAWPPYMNVIICCKD